MIGKRRRSRIRSALKCNSGIAAIEFAITAPILFALMFGTIAYGLYFTVVLGVRQAAAEGARAAMAGLSTTERTTLATARAQSILAAYAPLISSQPSAGTTVTAAQDGTGLFRVTVNYDIAANSFLSYAAFLPMPTSKVSASVVVSNGSY